MPSQFIGFDVIKILANGFQEAQAAETVQVFNLTTNASFGTLETDDFGFIATQEIAVGPGTKLKFSVTGYTPFIERTTANEANFDEVKELNLVLDDDRTIENVDAKSVDVYQKDENGLPILLGTAIVGETFKVPYLPTDKPTEFFLDPKDDKGVSWTTSLGEAPTIMVIPNLETATPDFAQNGAAQNAIINFTASNFSAARFRKIQIADNSGFTTNLQEIIEGNNLILISANFSITRSTGLSATKTVYVRIAHSSNNLIFGEWSPTKTATFTDSGGSGGSSGGNPPTSLSGIYFRSLDALELSWTNNGGTSDIDIYQNNSLIQTVDDSVNFYDGASLILGNNTFQVVNADGSSNTWEYYFDGSEV
jgi:hypothetical protein